MAAISTVSALEVLRRYPPHDGTLLGLLASRARVAPQQPCIEWADTVLSYDALHRRVLEAMAQFAARGVCAGDRVAVMSPNHPNTAIALIALASLGALMVGVNPGFGAAEAGYVIEHSGAIGVLCAPATLPVAQAVLDALPGRPWLLCHAGEATQAAHAAGVPPFPQAAPPDAAAGPGAPAASGGADDPCILVYTSGTTGRPKGVMHRQRTLVLAGEGFVQRMHLVPEDRLLCLLPMFHINAVFYSLMGALAAGATLLLEERFSAAAFWPTVAARRATEVNTIAAVMTILMRRPRSEFVPGHGLVKVYGAPVPPEAYRVFEQAFGVPHVIEGYGMSEIPGATSNPFDGERRIGSMGTPSRHPDPAVTLAEVRVVDDEGQALPAGAVGELVVRTPTIMQGYYRDDAATEAAFLPSQDTPGITPAALRRRWFRTGDLARIDADGYVWFVARRKDIIRRRGENISGAEIDRVACEHPQLIDAAAIGVPAELGEEEVLLVAIRQPGSTLTERELAAWCRERLAAFKRPRFVLFVDALPRTPTHRVAKFELRRDPGLLARAVDVGAG